MSHENTFESLHDSLPPMLGDASQVDEWIRTHIGRQILVGCSPDLPEAFTKRLERYHELRVAPLPSALSDEATTEAGVAACMRLDPHVLLFHVIPTSTESLAEMASRLYRACERAGALDQCLVALMGPAMTREVARSLAFEEGFADEVDEPSFIGEIVSRAVEREDAHQRGSSPPCYL